MASAMIFTAAYAGNWNGPLMSRFLSAKALTSAALAGSSEKSAGSVTSIPSEAGPAIAVTSLVPPPSGPHEGRLHARPARRAQQQAHLGVVAAEVDEVRALRFDLGDDRRIVAVARVDAL